MQQGQAALISHVDPKKGQCNPVEWKELSCDRPNIIIHTPAF